MAVLMCIEGTLLLLLLRLLLLLLSLLMLLLALMLLYVDAAGVDKIAVAYSGAAAVESDDGFHYVHAHDHVDVAVADDADDLCHAVAYVDADFVLLHEL